MSRLDELPPDQSAVLSLLLRQRKRYAQVAALLGISELAVHDRAHAALAVLAPRRARELTAERRLEIGDYLLGQQPGVAERLRTRTYLSGSEPAQAWAGDVAAQLAPLAGARLPEIPAVAGVRRPQRVADLSSAAGARGVGASPPPPPARSLPSSRVGGAVLLAVIAAAVIVAVILITSGGSNTKKANANATQTTSKTATKTGPTIDSEITLSSPDRRSTSVGVVYVLSEGSKRAFFIEAQHIPASKGFYYAIWLYNSHTSALALSRSPAVGSTHRLAGGSALPSNAGAFREILLTKETKPRPAHPGHVVLRGAFSLSG
jgi:hypothetical protein